MNPYQLYKIAKFPQFHAGNVIRNQIQMTFSGEGEEITTTIDMIKKTYEGSLAALRVKSAVRYEAHGFIKTIVDNQRRRLEFSEYLQEVDFNAYHDEGRKILLFQAPKKVCRGVLSNLRNNPCGVELIEMVVDFAKVLEFVSEYQGAWFRGVSPRVRSAGLSGDQIQHDELFQVLRRGGELSNVTFPWVYDGAEHKIMLTANGGIVLIQEYKANVGMELRLVMDVFENLLSKVWTEKKGRGRSSPVDIDAEP